MIFNEYLKGFDKFDRSNSINEMASELTKLGVPKNLMQFIHKLSGKVTRPREAQKQINPKTGKADIQFHTRREPDAAKKGPWPATEDVPLSHDVVVEGTKTGRRNIQYYLEDVIPKNKDTDIRLILVNPDVDLIYYITRKTGKTSPEERARKYGESDQGKSRELSRFDPNSPVSEKIGMYMRVVTIDGDSGEPIAAWEGTIGQMLEDVNDHSILYILEKEDRVRSKRVTRKDIKEVTEDKFIKYFIENFSKIAEPFLAKGASASRDEYARVMANISPEDTEYDKYSNVMKIKNASIAKKLNELQNKINGSKFDPDSLLPKLNNFQELAYKEGEYDTSGNDWSNKDKASLTHMVEIHSMPVVASMFLQFLLLGTVYKKFHTDDPFKELGLEELF